MFFIETCLKNLILQHPNQHPHIVLCYSQRWLVLLEQATELVRNIIYTIQYKHTVYIYELVTERQI